MAFLIREARLDDAGDLTDLLRSVGYFAYINQPPLEDVQKRITRLLEMCLVDGSHAVYVAEACATAQRGSGGRVLGYAAVHWLPYLILPGPEGYVSDLFVAPDARGQGVGGELLAVVREAAERRGCSRLALLNNRDRESYQRGFYAKRGWEERGEMVNFIYRLLLPTGNA
jgi:GNAT superfamily N-acetyltransferase